MDDDEEEGEGVRWEREGDEMGGCFFLAVSQTTVQSLDQFLKNFPQTFPKRHQENYQTFAQTIYNVYFRNIVCNSLSLQLLNKMYAAKVLLSLHIIVTRVFAKTFLWI